MSSHLRQEERCIWFAHASHTLAPTVQCACPPDDYIHAIMVAMRARFTQLQRQYRSTSLSKNPYVHLIFQSWVCSCSGTTAPQRGLLHANRPRSCDLQLELTRHRGASTVSPMGDAHADPARPVCQWQPHAAGPS